MKKKHEAWSKLAVLGLTSHEAGDLTKATAYHKRLRTLDDQPIYNAILPSNCGISSFTKYVNGNQGLVLARQRAGHLAATWLNLE